MLAIFIFQLLIFQVILIFHGEKGKNLFLKYVKEVSPNTIFEDDLEISKSIPYEKSKVEELFKKYNFPKSYNFFENTTITPIIKEQGHCGSCWAFASTSSLAYRFNKIGIKVDLSPQHELSCYHPDCVEGNNDIDAQLSLIKNGTISEQCLPYSSKNGSVEKCPEKCKNPNVEYKKYKASNAYYADINEDNFYDVTAIAIDQLITKGPLVSSMTVYEDFRKFVNSKYCSNNVYTYDGVSKYVGGHALTLVGYGLLNNKYYWLLQNSWGNESCQGGLVKVEFGQVGIGSVAFSEPYIEEEFYKIINVQFKSLHKNCSLEITTDTNNFKYWKSQLNIIYKYDTSEFDYICGVNKLITQNQKNIYCYYEINNQYLYKGLYSIKNHKAIGKENNFRISLNFPDFNFYGMDNLHHYSKIHNNETKDIYLFVSEKGSRITFIFELIGANIKMSSIRANDNYDVDLKNCKLSGYNLRKNPRFKWAHCDIDENELKYFDYYSTHSEKKFFFNQLVESISIKILSYINWIKKNILFIE